MRRFLGKSRAEIRSFGYMRMNMLGRHAINTHFRLRGTVSRWFGEDKAIRLTY